MVNGFSQLGRIRFIKKVNIFSNMLEPFCEREALTLQDYIHLKFLIDMSSYQAVCGGMRRTTLATPQTQHPRLPKTQKQQSSCNGIQKHNHEQTASWETVAQSPISSSLQPNRWRLQREYTKVIFLHRAHKSLSHCIWGITLSLTVEKNTTM